MMQGKTPASPFLYIFLFDQAPSSLLYSVPPLKLNLSSSAIVPKVSAIAKENKQANEHAHEK